MGPYKLLALDMDGTLLDEKQRISEANKEWMFKALDAGITVILATGRGVQNVYPYVDELQLKTPVISVNGSEVWRSPRELYQRQVLSGHSIRRMHDLALQYDAWYWTYTVDGLYTKDNWTALPKDEWDRCQWLKFGFYTDHAENLANIRKALELEDIYEITNSNLNNLEVNPKGVSKASGIRQVCRLLGYDMSQVVAMGDSLNDMAMIRAAGLGIAMGNAQQALKDAADAITVTNNESAVAQVIQTYVLNT